MIWLLCTLYCAALMRIKGGGVIVEQLDGKWVSSLGFGGLVYLLTQNWLIGTIAAACWLILCAPAVRDYLTNLGGYKGCLKFYGWGQHKYIVKVLDFLSEHYFKTRPVLGDKVRKFYGWVGTTIRGALFVLPMAIFLHPVFILAGVVMAPMYWFGISYLQYQRTTVTKSDDIADGWSLGEWFWGAAIGVALASWKLFFGGETWVTL